MTDTTQLDDLETDIDTPPTSSADSSLSGRMRERAEYLERHETEKFPIPGWEDVLAVELRVLGYSAIRKISRRNEKVRDETTRELYNLADQIVHATTGLYEVRGEGYRELNDGWVDLARRLPGAPDELTARRAVLFLVGEKRIHFLVAEWSEWCKSVRPDLDEEVVEDFGTTG